MGNEDTEVFAYGLFGFGNINYVPLPINNYLIMDKTTFKQEISAYTARGGKMTIVKLWL